MKGKIYAVIGAVIVIAFIADGQDEEAAVEALVKLVNSGFAD